VIQIPASTSVTLNKITMQKKTLETKFTIYTFDELENSYQQLINRAKEQVKKAYAPYSGFHVGAAIELENGKIFTGSNQENSAYPSGLCAERVAMFYANAQFPNVAAKSIAIAAFTNGNFLTEPITPCGSCRQVLLETEMRYEKDITILLYGTEQTYLIENVKQLLPLCFEKSSLNR
jgi:cytidine deaminase